MMNADGVLANSMGRVIGVGAGHGIALAFVMIGSFVLLFSVLSYANPRLRDVEVEIPDAVVKVRTDSNAGDREVPEFASAD
jgi:hypothetical protein